MGKKSTQQLVHRAPDLTWRKPAKLKVPKISKSCKTSTPYSYLENQDMALFYQRNMNSIIPSYGRGSGRVQAWLIVWAFCIHAVSSEAIAYSESPNIIRSDVINPSSIFYRGTSTVAEPYLSVNLSHQEENVQAELKQKISKRIKRTPVDQQHYAKALTLDSNQDQEKLTQVILNLTKDRTAYCEAQSILDDPQFKFNIFNSIEELEFSSPGSIAAVYTHATGAKRIHLLRDEINKDESYYPIIRHEIHHAFVHSQNQKTKTFFFNSKTKQSIQGPIPCMGENDCPSLIAIQQAGMHNVDSLLLILGSLDNKKSNLESLKQQNPLLKDYWDQFPNYQPSVLEMPVSRATLLLEKPKVSIRQHTRYYELTNSAVKVPARTRLGIFQRYAWVFKDQPGDMVMALTHSSPYPYLVPLLDLKYALSMYDKKDHPTYVAEFDAIIHELFGPYPALYNLLFEGLGQYHYERGDDKYQQCMQAKL